MDHNLNEKEMQAKPRVSQNSTLRNAPLDKLTQVPTPFSCYFLIYLLAQGQKTAPNVCPAAQTCFPMANQNTTASKLTGRNGASVDLGLDFQHWQLSAT